MESVHAVNESTQQQQQQPAPNATPTPTVDQDAQKQRVPLATPASRKRNSLKIDTSRVARSRSHTPQRDRSQSPALSNASSGPFVLGRTASTPSNVKRGYLAHVPQGDVTIRPIVFGSYAEPIDRTQSQSKRYPAEHTHTWKIFVRGYEGDPLDHWISHVVFRLHESFVNNRRAIYQPPYEVRESGWGEFDCGIDIYFKDARLKPITLIHLLKLYPNDAPLDPAQIEGPLKPVLAEQYDELIFALATTPAMREIFEEEQMTESKAEDGFHSDAAKAEVQEIMDAHQVIQRQLMELAESKRRMVADIAALKAEVNRLEHERLVQSAIV